MAALTASSVEQDSGTYSLVGVDWAVANGSWTLTRKATGGSTISLTNIGGTTQNPAPGSGNFVLNYTDGPSGSGSATGIVYTTASTFSTGNGVQVTLPADTSVRKATLYWGSSGTTARLTATLSDGSASAATHTVAAATDSQDKGFISTVQWQAGSASQTLTVKLTTDVAVDGNEQIAFEGVVYVLIATGAAASNQQPNTSAAVGSIRVSGSDSSTQASNTSSASGAIGITGSAASTQAVNVSAASGNVALTGAGASTQATGVSAASGGIAIAGSGLSTQTANSSSASGAVRPSGSAASTQQANTSAAAGAIKASASAASTQSPNTSSAAGAIGNIAQGSAASTQAANASAGSGAVSVSGAGASAQANNASSGAGAIAVRGSAASTQSNNASASAGFVAVSGTSASTQSANLSAASGSVSSSPATGSGSSTQAPNYSTAQASVQVSGGGASIQGANTSNASGVITAPQVRPTPLTSASVQNTSGLKMAAPVINSIAQFNFQIKQGSDLEITMTWLQDDGVTPVNLTGYAMKLEIRSYTGSPTILLTLSSANTTGSYIALGGTAGTVSLIFAHTDTATLAPVGLPIPGSPLATGLRAYQLGVYDLQFTDPTGAIGYLLEGTVSLDPQVTV